MPRRRLKWFWQECFAGQPWKMYMCVSWCHRIVSGATDTFHYMEKRRCRCAVFVARAAGTASHMREVSFDNGSACCLNALAAAGELWPRAVYCRHQPPCQTPAASRLHSPLRRDAVTIVSDPHRRWHCQKILPRENRDYWLFDQCPAYAPARISARAPLIPKEHQKTEPRVRGNDEDDAVLRQLAVLEDLKAMTACIKKASVWVQQRLQNLVPSHEEKVHGFWRRVFGCFPPDNVVCMRGEALEVHLHPNVAMTGYAAQDDCVSDARRIAHWFSQPRRVNKSVSELSRRWRLLWKLTQHRTTAGRRNCQERTGHRAGANAFVVGALRCFAPSLHKNGTDGSDGHNNCGAGVRRQQHDHFPEEDALRYLLHISSPRHVHDAAAEHLHSSRPAD